MENPLLLRLRNSANIIERNTAQLIELYFPYYEKFWQEFLEPIRGIDGNWRNDTLHNLEEIGMSQYAVLKSLNIIKINQNDVTVGDPYQRYKNIYFHFGLIFDSAKNLARNICIIGDMLNIISYTKKAKIRKLRLILNFSKWVYKNYDRSFDSMVSHGKPIFYYPHRDRNFLTVLMPKRFGKQYNKFVTDIMNYRNFYIHNPGVDIIISFSDNKLHAIKKENLGLYRHWSDIRQAFPRKKEHFDSPQNIIENDLKKTLNLLNDLWTCFYGHMANIANHQKYSKLLHNYDRTSRKT